MLVLRRINEYNDIETPKLLIGFRLANYNVEINNNFALMI